MLGKQFVQTKDILLRKSHFLLNLLALIMQARNERKIKRGSLVPIQPLAQLFAYPKL